MVESSINGPFNEVRQKMVRARLHIFRFQVTCGRHWGVQRSRFSQWLWRTHKHKTGKQQRSSLCSSTRPTCFTLVSPIWMGRSSSSLALLTVTITAGGETVRIHHISCRCPFIDDYGRHGPRSRFSFLPSSFILMSRRKPKLR